MYDNSKTLKSQFDEHHNSGSLPDIVSYVVKYINAGFNVLPLQIYKKSPVVKWKRFQQEKLSLENAASISWEGKNVGIITGNISNGLIVIDCDSQKSIEYFEQLFPYYANTYKVITRRGLHYYFKTNASIQTMKFDFDGIHIDVKAEGGYVVAPPSIVKTEDNNQVVYHTYKPIGDLEDIMFVPEEELQQILQVITEDATKEKKEEHKVFIDSKHNIDLQKFKEVLAFYYEKGRRNDLILYASGFLKKHNVSYDEAKAFFEDFFREVYDEEEKYRWITIEETYKKDLDQIAGYKGLIQYIPKETIKQCIVSETVFLPREFERYDKYLIYKSKRVCEFFVVSKVYEKLGTNTVKGYELSFASTNKKIFIPISVCTKQKFMSYLHEHGIPIDEEGASKALKYLAYFLSDNSDLIERVIYSDTIGWVQNEFYLPSIQKDILFSENLNGFGASGQVEKEEELLYTLFHSQSYLAFAYVLAVAPILLKVCSVKNFVIFAQGKTGSGKSTISFLALSLYGNYKKLMGTNDHANTGFEVFLKQRKDVLAVFDEVNTGSPEAENLAKHIVRNIYRHSVGKGRVRATIDITERETLTYENILYISSEIDFLTFLRLASITNVGALRRVVVFDFGELDVNVDRSLTSYIYNTIEQNYGNLIERVVDFIKNNQEWIKSTYANWLGCYTNEDMGYAFNGQEAYFAILQTAREVVGRLYSVNTRFLEDMITSIADLNHSIFNENVNITKDSLREMIFRFIEKNRSSFQVEGENSDTKPAKEIYGKIASATVVYLTSTGFEKLALETKMTTKDLSKLLLSFGFVESGTDRLLSRTTVAIFGVSLKAYKILLKET